MAVPNPKGTPENLVDLRKRSKEERKKIASMGGKASVKVRNKKKNMCELASAFLNAEIPQAEAKKQLAKLGVEVEEGEVITLRAILISELVEIVNSKSVLPADKMKAIKMLSEYAGETPEQLAAEAEESKHRKTIGDDPFSRSIKALIKNGNEED